MTRHTIAGCVAAALVLGITLTFGVVATGAGQAADGQRQLARQILQATGIQGGLIVQIGCGDGELTSALGTGERYLVHGLEADPRNLREARRRIRSLGLYGRVSVDRLRGERLPYIDNLVNLVVSADLGGISTDEVMRVLCPGGVAYVKSGGRWGKTVKPRPPQIDEWTHYLHDAGGNAVARDSVVGPPRHLQWVGSPRWARHHDRMASMTALVSSGGRIFYIFDEGSTASIQLPAKRVLIARDAFNGTILWKRPIDSWHAQLWPYKSGPAQLPRRLVAVGDRVYVTLGLNAPLCALDAATGRTVRTYRDSFATEEVIASEGVLFLQVNADPPEVGYDPRYRCMHEERNWVAADWTWDGKPRRIMAVEADTGEALWSVRRPVVPLTLAADSGGVFLHDGEKIVSLDRGSGKQRWSSRPVSRRSSIPTNFGPTLVVYGDVVLFSGGDRSMTALDAKSGRTLWTADHPPSGHHSPEDLLVAGGLVWSGAIAAGKDSGVFTGRDLRTGEVKSQFPPDVETYWFHHRCHRGKATERFLLPSRTGIEFVDFNSQHWDTNHWVRGGCIYGIMPCNGLVYAPPHSCACYIDAKLSGFNALAPASSSRRVPREITDDGRLERGPAFAGDRGQGAGVGGTEDWPTYRHDGGRSGRASTSVPAALEPVWQMNLGGKLSSLVVAGGKVFVAEVDAHTVHALDADSGRRAWSYTAGGRVDSPPTVWKGQVLFGSADGWVYCVRGCDGELIWRFRAAPVDRRLTAYEQLESVWPVHGSVLLTGGVVYCVAGRSMFIDGGMRLLRLDAKTGSKLSETVLDDQDPQTGKGLQTHVKGLNMPAALPDVLSTDGRYLYMRTQRFDMTGVRGEVAPTAVTDQDGEGVHLFCGAGFLDGTWFHRAYWIYGKSIASGANGWFLAGRRVPAGRLLVVDESKVYGFGRRPEYFRWSTPQEYHLFSAEQSPEIVKMPVGDSKAARRGEKCQVPSIRPAVDWSREVPLQARAMVLAAKTLFVAGPPDVLDEEDVFRRWLDPAIRPGLHRQTAALEGRSGAILWAVSVTDGKMLAQYRLESPPVWDGMAAAGGRLFVSTEDGKVSCFAGRR